MSVLRLQANKTPNEDVAFTNRAIFNPKDLDVNAVKYIQVTVGPARRYLFSTASNLEISSGQIGFSVSQRRWANISLLQEVEVRPFSFSATDRVISSISLSVDFNTTKKATNVEPLDSDKMSREFSMQFSNMVFTKGQELLFRYIQNDKTNILKIIVKSIQGISVNSKDQQEIEFGALSSNAPIVFDKVEGSILNLIGKSKGKFVQRSLINPEFDFQKLGIGGLDKEFSDIFRRAFSSRVFPPEYVEQLAMKHVRGILLYGPPGTGKTLIARQIGKMLNAREPKIVNGPEILNKFVGESEANMRKLFADAEEEWKRCGSNSGLHMIIFDEIDAICKQRGSMAGSTGVHDTVVNQLLTKLDGVEQLNNILVIGMTNRKDMIDEALLRPGRIEVQLEISLPDEFGRLQILRIHTARMREYKKLDSNVDLAELAKKTKNFSGAEIEGLVRAAQSSAMNRLVKVSGKVQVDDDAFDKFLVTFDDFAYALENDIKPAFGLNEEMLAKLLYGNLICWSNSVSEILEKGDLLVRETASPETCGFVRALLTGPRNSGKTFLAALIAKRSDFPFIKVCSPGDMIGFTETAKCAQLRKIFEDAYRSPLSCIIIDNIERLLDFSPVGMRYSNLVLQALLVLLGQRPPLNRRLLVLCTTSCEHFLREVDLINSFSNLIHVPRLTRPEHIITVLEETRAFSDEEINEISHELHKPGFNLAIGIKRLLELVDFVKQGKEGYRTRLLLEQLSSMVLGID